jgi:hypothetical protein
MTNKDQTAKQQKFQTNSKKQQKQHSLLSVFLLASRLKFVVFMFGPCLLFGACDLELRRQGRKGALELARTPERDPGIA